MAALQQTVRKFFPFITQKQKTKQIQRTEVTLCPSDTIANCGYLLAASTDSIHDTLSSCFVSKISVLLYSCQRVPKLKHRTTL